MTQQPYYTKIVVESTSKWRTSYTRYIPWSYPTNKNYPSTCTDCCTCEDPCQGKKKHSCCDDVKVPDCCLDIKKINSCVLRGKVLCEFDRRPVQNAVVFATRQPDDKVFSGITNYKGEYCICVPKGARYTIEAFLCCEDCITSVPCTCGVVNTCC